MMTHPVKKWFFLFCLAATGILFSCKKNSRPAYLNASLSAEKRAEDLLKRMTIEEKVAQLQTLFAPDYEKAFDVTHGMGNVCNIFADRDPAEAAKQYNTLQQYVITHSRLGIPVIYHGETVSGLMSCGMTIFPQPIARAAAFNPELEYKMADAIAREAWNRGITQVLSPDLNLVNDPRWGRVHETYGEDPWLASRLGVAFIKAFRQQGIICTPKHFVANIGEGGRFGGDVYVGERILREYYLYPFEAAVKEGGAGAIMPAYNSIDGIPCHAHEWLLNMVLRKEWKFDGFTSSDYGGVGGVLTAHRTAQDKKHAAALCLNAGMDVEMPHPDVYGQPLLEALKEGLVNKTVLDNAVRRVLIQKFRLRLFEDPYRSPRKAAMVCNHANHRLLAREYARQSVVLLKNENHVLPFSKKIKSIAVLGPLADDPVFGNYSPWGVKTVSVLEGIRQLLPAGTTIFFEKGVEFGDVSLTTLRQEDFLLPDGKGHGLMAEYFNNMHLEGQPVFSRTVPCIDFDWGEWVPETVVKADSFSVRYTGFFVSPVDGYHTIGLTVDDGARLYLDDKLIIDEWKGGSARQVRAGCFFEKNRKYRIKVEYYDNQYKALVRLGWDGYPPATINKAVDYARKAEAVVVVVGATDGEGRDRAVLELTAPQEALIKAVAATKKPMVVVLATGNVIAMSRWIDEVPAVIEQWHPGEEGGTALAEILFGDYSPGGKLPVTFPQTTGQVPLRYNAKPMGAQSQYIVYGNEPLFPFGYGLSYTSFEISNLKVASSRIRQGEALRLSVKVKNTGTRKGDEVIQIYVGRKYASVAMPEKELKDFRRVTLEPGETKILEFVISPDRLSLWDKNMKFVMEPGIVKVMAGNSSKHIYTTQEVEIVK